MTEEPLRIGNFSGFYGDRSDALREMLTGGGLDVLTGDYLAELTMLILARDRLKDPSAGYARTFLRQLEDTLGLAHEKGVRIVTNAGGLSPAGLARAVRELADRLGIPVRVAHVEGDDLTARHPGSLAHRGVEADRRTEPAEGRRREGHRHRPGTQQRACQRAPGIERAQPGHHRHEAQRPGAAAAGIQAPQRRTGQHASQHADHGGP